MFIIQIDLMLKVVTVRKVLNGIFGDKFFLSYLIGDNLTKQRARDSLGGTFT
ncbi:hypothetical protein KBB05_04225 [Patescibacteria group bacterium]|nr:hypothetical protein [Patescibacteria group bacterium]